MEKTFGPTIGSLIHDNLGSERVLLWDSKARGGRPNTMKILKEVYKSWEAEGSLCSALSRLVSGIHHLHSDSRLHYV